VTEIAQARQKANRLDRKTRKLERQVRKLRRERFRLRRQLALPRIVRLGMTLRAQGYRVAEHPAFGGVCARCHSLTGNHYPPCSCAIDVNYGPPGASAVERRKLIALAASLRNLPGLIELLHPGNDPAHDDHLHAAVIG
jgi:hypothetical protein